VTYEEWEAAVHKRVKREPVWQFLGYRKALFLYDLAWQDCERLMRDRRGRAKVGIGAADICSHRRCWITVWPCPTK
jgi:hypothetical protein